MKKILKNRIFRITMATLLVASLVFGYFFLLDKDLAKRASAGYLRLTETTDYFHVESDTYGIRVYKTGYAYYAAIYDTNSNQIGTVNSALYSGASFGASNDENRTVTLIENNKSRIVLKFVGKYDSTGSGTNYLSDGSNDVAHTAYFYIYKDHWFYSQEINAYNGVNLNGSSNNRIVSVLQSPGYFDEGAYYIGSSTGEILGSTSIFYNNSYTALLATNTLDIQMVKLSEQHNATSTYANTFYSGTTQNMYALYYNNIIGFTLSGINKSVFAFRLASTTEASRIAWAQEMINSDIPSMTTGEITTDYENEVAEPYNADGTYHLNASDNKAKFTLHAEDNASALVSATTTGGASSISFDNDTGLHDPGGTSTSWASIGNRLPYGSFDVNDPDVLFYWDMDNITNSQALNKGLGTAYINGTPLVATGTANSGIEFNSSADYVEISRKNIDFNKGAISFWYKSLDTNPTQYAAFFSLNSYEEFYLLRSNSNTQLKFRNNSNLYAYSSPDIFDTEWHFIKVTWDSNSPFKRIYIDGKLISESTNSFSPTTVNANLLIGRAYNSNYYCDGIIDEFYISQDPDQPDAPSFYDVIKYTDKSGTTLTGIPETGEGSMKWNHPPLTPIVQTTKQSPIFTIHDWHPKTKSTTTGEFVDHLVLDLPLDGVGSNENSNKVWDKASESWIGTTSNGVSFEQARQGNGADFDADNEYIDLPSTIFDNIGPDYTIEFTWIPDHDFNSDATSYYLFEAREISDPGKYRIRIYKSWGVISVQTNNNWVAQDFNYNISGIDYKSGDRLYFRFAHNGSTGQMYMYLNGVKYSINNSTVEGNHSNTYAPIDSVTLGSSSTYGSETEGMIDNFRIYNDVILPYGAYYTGYEQNGHYEKAHPDILGHLSGREGDGETLSIGTSSTINFNNATQTTGIDGTTNSAYLFDDSQDYIYWDGTEGIDWEYDQGSISFWYKNTAATTSDNQFFIYAQDKSDSQIINGLFYKSSTGLFRWYYTKFADTALNNQNANINAFDGNWHHFYFIWDNSADFYKLYLDGVYAYGLESGLGHGDFESANLRIFLSNGTANYQPAGIIDEIYITNSPDTPRIPTAFGKPIINPQINKSTTNLQIKNDYDVAMLNDVTSWIVQYNHDVANDTTFVISESLNPVAVTDTAIPIDRVHPLLHVSATTGNTEVTVQRGDGTWSDDFKLVFKEADAGVSECYLGQGTSSAASAWGTNLCSATELLTEIDQNSVIQTDQTGVLNIIQDTAVEAIIRNMFILPSEATSTEEWHIFSDGTVVIDRKYEKTAANSEERTINTNFSNYAFYPATPDISRIAGTYHDSFMLHLVNSNTDIQTDYLNPHIGATSTISGQESYMGTDINADGFLESRGTYGFSANYQYDPSIPQCEGVCGQPIYHTIGTSSSIVNVTTDSVDEISNDLWIVKFSGSPDLSNIHKRDKFTDGGGTQYDWNIIHIDDDKDQIIVGDQEQNGGSPSALNTNQATVGPWYTSLFDWEAAEDRDLTSTSRYPNGEIEMAECWPLNDRTSLDVSGWTTGETNYIKIYTPPNQRHKGVWNENYYNLVTQSGDISLYLEESYMTIDGLQIKNLGTASTDDVIKIYEYRRNFNIFNSIITGGYYGIRKNILSSSGYIVFANNIIYNTMASCITMSGPPPVGHLNRVYNTTVYNCNKGNIDWGGGIAVEYTNGTIVKNCISINSTFTCNGCEDIKGIDTNSISSDNSASGKGSIINVSSTTNPDPGAGNYVIFKNLTPGSEDFHLVNSSDNDALNAGVNLANDYYSPFSFDIDGETRDSVWSIGADEPKEKYLNKTKFELDGSSQTLYQPKFLINDFYPASGKTGSEEEYILFHDTMDSIIDGHQPKVGSGTVIVIKATSTIGVRNTSALFDYDSQAYFKGETNGNVDRDKGAVSFWYTPESDTIPDYCYFYSFRNQSPWFTARAYTNNVTSWLYGTAATAYDISDYLLKQEPIHFLFSWLSDSEKSTYWISINGKTVASNAISPPEITSVNLQDNFYIGNNGLSGWFQSACGSIDEFKIYSEPILPFGAFYTGYDQNNNYSGADPNLLFYWDAEKTGTSASQIPNNKTISLSGAAQLSSEASIVGNFGLDTMSASDYASISVNGTDLIDGLKGSISMWINIQGFPGGFPYFFGYGEANNDIMIGLDSSNNWKLYYTANGTTEVVATNYGPSIGEWHHVRATWDVNEKTHLYVDGVEAGTPQDIAGTFDYSGGTIYLGSNRAGASGFDCFIDQIFITNNPHSQEIPTAFGKPLRMPLMAVGNTRQKYGYDYIASFTPDPSTVIIQYFKNVNKNAVFEIGDSEGTAQTKRIRGGVRVEGGVRF